MTATTYTVTLTNGDAFRVYSTLSDLLTDGFRDADPVEVDNGIDVVTTTVGELAADAAATYVRGTATHRGTTASLRAGDRVLVACHTDRFEVAHTKTGSSVRTVAGLEAFETAGGFHRRSRRYNVRFTDGTVVENLAPVQSWHVVTVEVEVVEAVSVPVTTWAPDGRSKVTKV
jgi:hypothetical protein